MIDVILIVGKYFESNKDYINVMKVTKKYHDLVEMYHFNPIEDCSLFNKMETQHLYNKEESHKKNGMIEYIHWYPIEYSELNNNESKDVFKRVEIKRMNGMNKEYPLSIEDGHCIVPNRVTSIGKGCFAECTTLTSVQFPTTLLSIGNGSFYCTNIKTINIPDGVTIINNNCFSWCSLTNVRLHQH